MKNAKKFIINVRQLTVLLIVFSLLLIFILASTCFTSNKNVLAETNHETENGGMRQPVWKGLRE